MARSVFGSGLPKALAGSAVCFGVLAMAGPLIMPMVLDVKTQEIVNSLISGSDPPWSSQRMARLAGLTCFATGCVGTRPS
jgi:hypothetical protein